MLDLFLFFLKGTPSRRRKQFWALIILIVFSGVVELFALLSLATFIASLTSPVEVLESRYVVMATNVFGYDPKQNIKDFYVYFGLWTLLLIVLKNILIATHSYATARFDGVLNVDSGVRVLGGFLSMPFARSSEMKPSEVHQILGWKTHVGGLASSLMLIMSDTVVSLLMLLSLFVLAPVISICVAFGILLFGSILFRFFRNKINQLAEIASDLYVAINGITLKSIHGIRDIKHFNAEDESLFEFRKAQSQMSICLAKQRLFERAPAWVLETVGMGAIIISSVFVFVFFKVSTATLMQALSMVAVAAWRILPAVNRSIGALGNIRGIMPPLKRVRHFIEECERYSRIRSKTQLKQISPLSHSIEAQGVSFRYNKESDYVLSKIDLSVSKGEFLGIIGHSGGGKSTLVDILTGLLFASEGNVYIDGVKLDLSTDQSWNLQVGFVPQKPFLFDGSIAANVAFTIDEKRVDYDFLARCCRSAGVTEFASSLPNGLKTEIREQGARLSGGQAQRIAVARALYRNPEVLIFDEATSSLDYKNQELLTNTMIKLRGIKTMIVVAHRLDTVKYCDRVVVIENGRLVDSGSPEVVLARYANDAKLISDISNGDIA
ncbi:ABC transporter ATP-binding protein [Salidesulfovibrio brasiliensis]